MKNCPVVTDGVVITAADIAGAQLDVTTDPDYVGALRSETRERARKFPFTGSTITVVAKP